MLWPASVDPAEIERVALEERGLPESTYHALARAAELWPQRPAIHCLPDGAHWEQPSSRTFAELAADVHRAASVYADLGVGRHDAVALVSVNCEEMLVGAARRRGGRRRGTHQPGAGRRARRGAGARGGRAGDRRGRP